MHMKNRPEDYAKALSDWLWEHREEIGKRELAELVAGHMDEALSGSQVHGILKSWTSSGELRAKLNLAVACEAIARVPGLFELVRRAADGEISDPNWAHDQATAAGLSSELIRDTGETLAVLAEIEKTGVCTHEQWQALEREMADDSRWHSRIRQYARARIEWHS